nr:reverse transcriptase zinc-binding domain-containing protein [Tanacetum cinerariifolium]
MPTQEGMVNEGISLHAGLDSKASTYDHTSIEQHDESSSSGSAALLKEHRQELNLREIINTWNNEGDVLRKVQERLSKEFEPLTRNINLQQNSFEKNLFKEMKDNLKYVMSLEDEFDENCLILDIQT